MLLPPGEPLLLVLSAEQDLLLVRMEGELLLLEPPTDGLDGRLAPGGPTDLGLRHIRLAGRLLRELLRLLDKAGHLRDLTPAR